jgi:uridine kinase
MLRVDRPGTARGEEEQPVPAPPAGRDQVLERLAEAIAALQRPHPLRVAVDGCSAAGKSTLADELVGPLRRRGRPVIRVSLDDFKRPLPARRLPRDTPEGYYLDTYDYPVIRAELLEPLGPGGDRRYRPAVFDNATQAPVAVPARTADPRAVVLVDGAFLLREELDGLWEYRIFVDVGFDLVLARGVRRDQAFMASPAAARERYLRRYIPGERRYLRAVRPRERADVVVDNRDLERPRLAFRAGRRPAQSRTWRRA